MRKILLAALLMVTVTAFAQDIPKGVVYKKTTDANNQKAKDLILQELGTKGTYSLFDSIVIIGPALWDRYSKIKNLAAIKEGNISLKVASYDATTKKTINELVAAKLIQRKVDYTTLVKQLVKDINNKPLKFRKLSTLDLTYYWSVIFFDIEEPIFIVEANGKKFLIDIDNNKIRWIDEVL
jgi:hypothetical protein